MSADEKPTIQPMQDGPYVVEGLRRLGGREGPVETSARMALCRCGASNRKPFCDGTHAKIGFSSAKQDGRQPDRRDDYAGAEITIHDNRGLCAHAGYCTDNLPAVFKLRQEPWIEPDGADASEVARVIGTCPSGALSYTVRGEEHRDREGDPAVFIAPNGPYVVSGGPELLATEGAEGASAEHYTLCRCGGSKNKPFCDGTHWHVDFEDDAG